MKFLLIVFALLLTFSLINCQKEVEEVEEDKTFKTKNDKSDNPLTPSPNGGRSLIGSLVDRMRSGFDRIRTKFQESYQKNIERLQRKAVDSLESLQDFVNRQITPTTDPNVKEYLQSLSESIGQLRDSLKSLITSFESQVSEARDKLPKVPNIPEYKISDENP